MASSMKAAIHLVRDFLMNSDIYKNTRFENIENVFNIIPKLIKEQSEEILNVRCLEYSSPSWTRSILVNNQAIKWAKAKVCVYGDSVLCVGRMENGPGTQERRWKGHVEDLMMYASFPDAVVIDGEAIEFDQDF